MPDKIQIEITPEGLIKTSTDKISLPNHAGSEAFIREMARLAGGKVERKRKHGHSHTHSHQGEHHHH